MFIQTLKLLKEYQQLVVESPKEEQLEGGEEFVENLQFQKKLQDIYLMKDEEFTKEFVQKTLKYTGLDYEFSILDDSNPTKLIVETDLNDILGAFNHKKGQNYLFVLGEGFVDYDMHYFDFERFVEYYLEDDVEKRLLNYIQNDKNIKVEVEHISDIKGLADEDESGTLETIIECMRIAEQIGRETGTFNEIEKAFEKWITYIPFLELDLSNGWNDTSLYITFRDALTLYNENLEDFRAGESMRHILAKNYSQDFRDFPAPHNGFDEINEEYANECLVKELGSNGIDI